MIFVSTIVYKISIFFSLVIAAYTYDIPVTSV